jgi:hypothetical protein
MANIAVGDVTHLVLNQRKMADSRNMNRVRLSFGDSSLTYPAGGIPIAKGKMGCPTVIESIVIVDKGTSGYTFTYDQSAEKIVMHQAPKHGFLVTKGAIVASTELGLSADAATATVNNNTIASTLTLTTNSPIVAAALSEPSAVAIAAQVIELEVIGY